MTTNRSMPERIAVLETKVQELTVTNKEIRDKLDELLQLRSKGMGAFWLASSLLGTGIMGGILAAVDWIRSWH